MQQQTLFNRQVASREEVAAFWKKMLEQLRGSSK